MNHTIGINLPLLFLQWIARIGSVASIAVLITLFIGELLHPSQIAHREMIGLLFFPIGVMVGMIIAWWKEGVGASITIASLITFYLVYGYLLGSHIGGWAFVTFSSPGFFFLLHWILVHVYMSSVINDAGLQIKERNSVPLNRTPLVLQRPIHSLKH